MESLVYPSERFPQGGLEYLQRVCGWASDAGLFIIIDMHGAPGAQTADSVSTGQVSIFKVLDKRSLLHLSNYRTNDMTVCFLCWLLCQFWVSTWNWVPFMAHKFVSYCKWLSKCRYDRYRQWAGTEPHHSPVNGKWLLFRGLQCTSQHMPFLE